MTDMLCYNIGDSRGMYKYATWFHVESVYSVNRYQYQCQLECWAGPPAIADSSSLVTGMSECARTFHSWRKPSLHFFALSLYRT